MGAILDDEKTGARGEAQQARHIDHAPVQMCRDHGAGGGRQGTLEGGDVEQQGPLVDVDV